MRAAVVVLAVAAAVAAPASAQGPAPARGLVAACFTCHGTDGRSAGTLPSLAGQSKEVLLQKMKDFRTGKLPATIMHQQAKGYTDAELERIADYFSRMSPGSGSSAPGARGY